jgi:hypothetical protein
MHTITGVFQVFNKKNREARKKKKNYDVPTSLLLAVTIWANEQADGADETTKRKLGRLVAATEREKSACMRQ